MDSGIEKKFEKMGARLKLNALPDRKRRRRLILPISIDIRRDNRGEYFDLRCRPDVDVQVLDVRPADRHLLLMAREPGARRGQTTISRFLCGHDERSWFVAAVPERARASSVQNAKDALKPQAVWDAINQHGVPMKHRDSRRTEAFVRQGEWFFIPRPRLVVDEKLVLRNEPIRRGSGKPHMCQFLYRTGGVQVYVSRSYPDGLTVEQYHALPQEQRQRQAWRAMVRDARVYARGAVRHPDHKTVWLTGWHQVVVNTESQAAAMRHVAFLD